MSTEFMIYGFIAICAWLIAIALVTPRNLFDLSRCAGWYMLVFLATYVVRPAASQLTGDTWLYDWLKIGRFEEHWYLMAIAVPMAIISFGIGYRCGGPGQKTQAAAADEPVIDPSKVRRLIYFLIFLGYVSVIISVKTGTFGGDSGNYAGASVGTYEHNTAWFAQDDLFISTGTILYYIVTGNLAMSLMLSGPWLVFRVIFGWGRSFLLGHFFALMVVYLLKARGREKSAETRRHQNVLIAAAIVLVLVLFPMMAMLRALKSQLHLGAGAISKDAIAMMSNGADPQEMLQTYVGTTSSVTGFETTLGHLLDDKRSEMGTAYLYYYVFQPVPRIIWPGKGTPYTWPEDLRGVQADPLLTIIGAAPGSIGMAYEQWGWLGIPIEFLLTGIIIRKSEEVVIRRPKALHVQLAYAGFFSMSPQFGRDSLFYMIPNAWLFRFGIPVLILWIMYRGAAQRQRWREAALVSALAGPAAAHLNRA